MELRFSLNINIKILKVHFTVSTQRHGKGQSSTLSVGNRVRFRAQLTKIRLFKWTLNNTHKIVFPIFWLSDHKDQKSSSVTETHACVLCVCDFGPLPAAVTHSPCFCRSDVLHFISVEHKKTFLSECSSFICFKHAHKHTRLKQCWNRKWV